jgi:hypothetical protein
VAAVLVRYCMAFPLLVVTDNYTYCCTMSQLWLEAQHEHI